MSTTAQPGGSPGETLAHLVREDPLAHPLAFAIRHAETFGHEQAAPPHVREILHSVFTSFTPEYPNAPKTRARFYPRGHAKSETGSAALPVWKALRDPDVRILIMMLNTEEAMGKLEKCEGYLRKLAPQYDRRIVEGNKTRLTLDRDTDHSEPTIRAAGFKTGVTGGRYEYIIFDDIIDWEAQRTEQRREKIEKKFEDHLNLRASDDTVFLTLGTRKHPHDLYQGLIDSGGWDTEVEKAISDWSIVENNEYDLITTSKADGKERRYPANEAADINTHAETIVAAEPHRWCDVLWPERRPLDNLLVDLHQGFGQTSGSRVWRREMQNKADVFSGQVLSADMLHWTPTLPGRQSDYVRFAGLDLGIEKDPEKAASNDTDYWALSILAHNVGTTQTYLEDVWRERGMTLQGAIEWLATKLGRYDRLTNCKAEANQGQDFFVQAAQSAGLPVEASTSSGAKEDRIISMSAMFESGDVKLVGADNPAERSERWTDFVDEWTGFPSANHDDLLDSVQVSMRNLTDNDRKTARVYDIGF